MAPDGQFDVLVVGAGFAGSILAERIASQLGQRVLVVDRRDHIGGNAYDYVEAHGVLCHRYGPHIFHTASEKVAHYLSRFTVWRPYEHRVLAHVRDMLLPMPINRDTLNRLYGLTLSSEEDARDFLAARAEPRDRIENSEDTVVAKVGRELYETFFRGYTRKQWALDPSELDASVCARIPIRFNRDDRYFTDAFQQMPADGYTAMFRRMLDQPGIEVRTATSFEDVRDEVTYRHVVYTGPIDAYFGYRFGRLPYRSLAFEHERRPTPNGELAKPAGQINYPSEDVAYTRISEYRHLTGQSHASTTLAFEYPRSEGEPYYPIPKPENRLLYKRYAQLAAAHPGVTFVGRLARYQYLNMDQVVGQALAAFATLAPAIAPEFSSP